MARPVVLICCSAGAGAVAVLRPYGPRGPGRLCGAAEWVGFAGSYEQLATTNMRRDLRMLHLVRAAADGRALRPGFAVCPLPGGRGYDCAMLIAAIIGGKGCCCARRLCRQSVAAI
ncbi:MAG: hypothetical protein ACLTZY_02885 [Alistipes indistinctus]